MTPTTDFPGPLRRRRVLLTGASGMLGQALAAALRREGAELGVVTRSGGSEAGPTVFHWDISAGVAPPSLRAWRPAFVVHAAAATNVDRCEREPGWARAVNVSGTARVVELAADAGARLLHVSTDSVFRGDRGWYGETDVPDPVNVYAATKLAGERLAASAEGALAVRLNVVGAAPGRLTDWILRGAALGQPLRVFTDVIFNPVEVTTLAGMLTGLLASPLTGVCHVGADEAISKAEYASRLVRYAGLWERARLEFVPLGLPSAGAAARPRNTSLRSSDAVRERFPDPSLDAAARRLAAEFAARLGAAEGVTQSRP